MLKSHVSKSVPRAAPQKDHGFAISLMEHLVVPTFVLDIDSRVIIWNKACERLTGVSAEDVIGTIDYWRAFYDERSPCLADFFLALLTVPSRRLPHAERERKTK